MIQAAELTFTPQTPIVEINKTLTLSVSGMSGDITWMAVKGQIQGSGNEVTYTAPNEGGIDVVTVLDTESHVGTLKITVTKTLADENAVWKVFTNRNFISAILLSEDGKTLWVGTNGGLEKHDAITGNIKRVFTNLDGLPFNKITAISGDGKGGLWIGTGDERSIGNNGLVHLTTNEETGREKVKIFNNANSPLFNDDYFSDLVGDGNGGVWLVKLKKQKIDVILKPTPIPRVGTLVHLNNKGELTTFDNELHKPVLTGTLTSDDYGGVWITIELENNITALAYVSSNNEWEILENTKRDYYELPHLLTINDGKGGLWLLTRYNELTHFSNDNNAELITVDISHLPNLLVSDNFALFNENECLGYRCLISDGKNGLWMGTTEGLAHLNSDGEWEMFNKPVTALAVNEIGELWIGTNSGLAYLDHNKEWKNFSSYGPEIPDNFIYGFAIDDNGLWVGTKNGLGYLSNDDREWTIFNTDNSDLPQNSITALTSDGKGGIWVGISGCGLAHLDSSGQGTVFKVGELLKAPQSLAEAISRNNKCGISKLPSDGQGGIWVEGKNLQDEDAESFIHFNKNNEKTIYYPNSDIQIVRNEELGIWLVEGVPLYSIGKNLKNQEGVWATKGKDLLYFTSNGEWTIFDTDNSDMPSCISINAIVGDDKGGVWIGTSCNGLAHLNNKGKGVVFDTDNSELPHNWIHTLLNDNNGGVWVGTANGLVHINSNHEWTVFNVVNSGLPFNNITGLMDDGHNGLWISTAGGGLAHFTVKPKSTLNRAAIIIAGGGDSDNTLWETTESISNYLYSVFHKKGFNNEDIYYLSPKSWADFNGDGRSDRIVDAPKPERPLTVEDIRVALAWAKTRGQLERPLFLFFLDHGGPEKFQLSKLKYMTAPEFKAILDDYQTATGNEIIIVIDACYSGMLSEQLIAPKRAIISSTSNGLAYFDRRKKQGFSRSFGKGLLQGMNFYETFKYATREQKKMLGKISSRFLTGNITDTEMKEQIPQLEDGSNGQWLRQVSLNEGSIINKATLKVDSLTTSTGLTAGQPFPLQVKTTLTRGRVKQVWAVIKPPKMNLVLDSNGTPILAFPRVNSFFKNQIDNVWEATWYDAVYNGDYEVTFYAKDSQSNIASSDNSVVVTVTDGIDPPPQTTVQIVLEKDSYRKGEPIKAELIENLGWGYDLYAAVKLPNGQITVIKNTNDFVAMESPINWLPQKRQQNEPLTLLDLTLPANLQTGQYCLYGILSPENEPVLDENTQARWILEENCFEVSP